MEFPRREYWSGLPFPSPGDLPTQGLNLGLWHCSQILFSFSGKVYCARRGTFQSFLAAAFLMVAGTSLSSSLHLSMDASPHPFLDQLEGPLVLGDSEQLSGPPFIRGETTRLAGRVPHELGVFGEAPAAAATCLGLLASLVTLGPLLRPTAPGSTEPWLARIRGPCGPCCPC